MAEKNEFTKLKLKDVKVIFFNVNDDDDQVKKYGKSITIDCTDEALRKQIADWVKENNIGEGSTQGVANFGEWHPDEGDTQYNFRFKLTDYTQFAGINGLGKDDIGRGAKIDLRAGAFNYTFAGKNGVGKSANAIVVRSGATAGSTEEDLAELLGDLGEEPEEEVKVDAVPF